jgi:hypothetical protein
MTHKDIKQIEDKNLKKIMMLIKKLETSQNKLKKVLKNHENKDDK